MVKIGLLTSIGKLCRLKYMGRSITFFVSLFICFFVFSVAAVAADNKVSTSVASFNSFEVFWPLVAGKTPKDGVTYSLKLFKENVREGLIFGKAEKANYKVFQTAKRLLEAESLSNEQSYQLANKTIRKAASELDKAHNLIKIAKQSSQEKPLTEETIKRLESIHQMSEWLIKNESLDKGLLGRVTTSIGSISELVK